MGVISVKTRYGTGKGSADSDRINTYTLELDVRVDDVGDGPAVILADSRVPKVGDEYATGNDYDPGSFCQLVEIERDSDVETLFHVKCEYDNHKEEQNDPNPLLRPATLDWSNRREEFFFPKDTMGNWYKTPAGVPLENPPATPLSLLILTITKNVETFNPINMNEVMDGVNADAFLGFQPGYCKIEDINPSKLQHEGEYQYYIMETVIAIRRIPWHPHYEVAKGRHRKNDAGDLIPTDASGVLTDHEVYLDKDGKPVDLDHSTPWVLEFFPYPVTKFSGLAQFTGLVGFWQE